MNALHRNVSALDRPYGHPLAGLERSRQGASAMIAAAIATLSLWSKRMRERDELSKMNVIERQDLSLSPCDIERETSKWFWQA